MPAFIYALLPMAILLGGLLLVVVAIVPDFRSKVLNSLRNGRSASYQTETIVSWLSFIVGMSLISMVVPYQVSMAIWAGALIYFVAAGR